MAQQIGGRIVQPAPPKPRRQFLPEATAAAQATGEILGSRFGPQPWIEQVMFAVQNAVQNGIENLSGTSISSNAHPEDGYRYRARTKDELLQSAHLVANARDVARGDRAHDPAVKFLGAPEMAEDGTFLPTERTAPASSPPAPQKPKGWLL